MSRTLFWALALPALAATAPLAPAQQEKSAPGKGGPVAARLVADKSTYQLDLAGLSGEEYRKRVQDSAAGGPGVPAPKVSLALELVNTGDKDVEVRYGGTRNVLTLDLKGPGAETIAFRGRLQPRFLIAPKTVTLAPGKSVRVPISSLAFGLRGLTHAAYWTAPGAYTLAAGYEAAIRPAPAGGRDAGDGFGAVTLTTAPIKLKVE
jgi:hypothetical protein